MSDEERAALLERLVKRQFECRCLTPGRGVCDGCRLNLLADEVRRLRALTREEATCSTTDRP